MTEVEKNVVFNIVTNPDLAYKQAKLMKGRWFKIYHKYFTESFGVEIEIPIKIHGYNRAWINYRLPNDKEYLNSWKHLNTKLEYSKDHAKFVLDLDCSTPEFQGFVTIYNLHKLETCLKILKKQLLNRDKHTLKLNTLHIHIPVSKSSIKGEWKVYKFMVHPLWEYFYKLLRNKVDFSTDGDDLIYFENFIGRCKIIKNYDNNVLHPQYIWAHAQVLYSTFNTLEYRGLSMTNVTYLNLMQQVFLINAVHRYLYRDIEPDMNLVSYIMNIN